MAGDLDVLTELGIPSDYGLEPYRPRFDDAQDLVEVEANIIGRMQWLAPETARDWLGMKEAADLDGVTLLLVSGFRSVDYQAALLRSKIEAGQDLQTILSVNAAPGYSEHHSGRAVDIATPGVRPLTAEFEQSAAFGWLLERGIEFDFRMTYGRGNPQGFEYEPWHWSQSGE